MTAKLVKYELRSTIKSMWSIWVALPALSLILLGVLFVNSASDSGVKLLSKLLPIASTVLFAFFVAISVLTVQIVIQRFSKGLLGDEGYLLHTLPVKPGQLVLSRGIAAAITVLISILVGFVSALLQVVVGLAELMVVVKDLFRVFIEETETILIAIEMILAFVLFILKAVYKIYAALAIGQLSNKHRTLISLVAYIAISVLMTTLGLTILDASGSPVGALLDRVMGETVWWDWSDSVFMATQLILAAVILLETVPIIIYHFITERLIAKSLNLL